MIHDSIAPMQKRKMTPTNSLGRGRNNGVLIVISRGGADIIKLLYVSGRSKCTAHTPTPSTVAYEDRRNTKRQQADQKAQPVWPCVEKNLTDPRQEMDTAELQQTHHRRHHQQQRLLQQRKQQACTERHQQHPARKNK